jgi:hypothetical protein
MLPAWLKLKADLSRPITEALGIDWSQIPSIACPTFTRTWKERLLETLHNSDLVNAVLSLLPEKAIRAAKGTVKKTLQQPGLSQGMALLYQCQYKLPIQKAEKILRYEPIVSFSEACDHTVDWLSSVGYPVVSQRQ